eukprot:9842515-Ditylum_brightwellii.AAC.2
MCPEAKKNETSKGKKKANGTANVTYTDDGKILSGDDRWGEDERLTGIMFCTSGVMRSYNDALKYKLSQPNLKTSTDHIFHQAHGMIIRKWLLLDSQSTVNI